MRNLFGIKLPIIQAPMAGYVRTEMVIAVSEAGGLGSLPCALLSAEELRGELGFIRARTSRPINVNFFCHRPPAADLERERVWRERLASYYVELGLDPAAPVPSSSRTAFDSYMCDVIVEFKPEVVSFHFGLPEADLVARVKATGAKVLSSATSVDEARWLEDRGCDAIIAQGFEAGGHRGMFLSSGYFYSNWNDGACASGGGRGERSGDCGWGYWRRAGYRGGVGSWRVRGTAWDGLSVLPGGEAQSGALGRLCGKRATLL